MHMYQMQPYSHCLQKQQNFITQLMYVLHSGMALISSHQDYCQSDWPGVYPTTPWQQL